MWNVRIMMVLMTLWLGQALTPSYIQRGDQVEQQFRVYTDDLDGFLLSLRELVARETPALLPELDSEDPAPEPGIYGYQLLPPIVAEPDSGSGRRIATFSYSWEITASYMDAEATKLEKVRTRLAEVASPNLTVVRELIGEYRTLVDNLERIDQYLQYNRFWQRAIAQDRPRYDRLTEFYDMLVSEEPGADAAIREFLGRPSVPSYIEVDEPTSRARVLQLPVYTDIADDDFLEVVESGVEAMWTVTEDGFQYLLDIEFRKVAASTVYATGPAPERGDHIDLASHAMRFPDDGALFTTGAESTFGFVGDYVALGPGEITMRTLAHEFGHVLGFADGYVRGYRDLGDDGFEILELTSAFDDIMSAPREGHVLPSHFELLMEGVEGNESNEGNEGNERNEGNEGNESNEGEESNPGR